MKKKCKNCKHYRSEYKHYRIDVCMKVAGINVSPDFTCTFFEHKQTPLPKSFEELQESNLELQVCELEFPSDGENEACEALKKLCWLRDAYNGCSFSELKEIDHVTFFGNKFLKFKTRELGKKYLKEPEIQKLISTAKPLFS